MAIQIEHEWKEINVRRGERTERMAIPGGYLYRTRCWDSYSEGACSEAVAMIFVPDSSSPRP